MITFQLKDVYIESISSGVDSSTQRPYRVATTVRSKRRSQLIYGGRQGRHGSRRAAVTVRRQTDKTTGMHKDEASDIREGAGRQTDGQQKLINVDREADTQEDR